MGRASISVRCVALLAALSVVLVVLAGLAAPVAADEKPAYRVDDVSLVYLGNPRQFKKPCAVDADRVYRAIPEYREILEKNLTDRDARYHMLLRRASDKFSAALRAVASEGGYDLAAGIGAVTPTAPDVAPPPVVTDTVIGRLAG